MTIFDVITSERIVAYWESKQDSRTPWLFEELFDTDQKRGLTIKSMKGKSGVPKVLNPSAFDVAAIPRPRIGAEAMIGEMPFFKESKYIDEELRQELNMVLETQNQAYIDTIIASIFNDEEELLLGAAAQRERMRAQAVTMGSIIIEGNGQVYEYDYGFPDNHKATVSKSWSDPTADIIEDIRAAKETVRTDQGVEATRAVCSSKVFGYFRKNNIIKQSNLALSGGVGYLNDTRIREYIMDELGIQIVVYDKRYIDEAGVTQRYVPEDTFTMFPDGMLGTMMFGTTPEQSDLMSSNVANVAITDVGVAVTTVQETDPVNVETKVTQICLPILPTADQIFIYDVVADSEEA